MRTFALTLWRQSCSSGCHDARFVVVFVTQSNEGLEGLGRPGPTEPLGPGPPRGRPRPTSGASDLDELDAGELAEVTPRRGVVAQVHHLVVRPAPGQPPVQAVPHPGCRAELPIGHLK